jgi:hypothetical protein
MFTKTLFSVFFGSSQSERRILIRGGSPTLKLIEVILMHAHTIELKRETAA